MKNTTAFLLFLILLHPLPAFSAARSTDNPIFKKIKLYEQNGDRAVSRSVIVEFGDDAMTINSNDQNLIKTIKYHEIRRAEYSYSKNPRWKTGLGLGAIAIVVFPLWFVAIPLGFTKHRRHWVTIVTNGFAVLKLSKSNRKIFIPTFETKAGIPIQAVGDEK